MPRFPLSVLLVAAPLIASCDPQPVEPSDPPAGLSAPVSAAAAETEAFFAPKFDPDSFVRRVDNRFFPLVPGTRFVYKGEEDGENETNVTLVTRDRKNILGISAVVVLDRVFVDGELKEKTFDTQELEDVKVVSTEGSWQAGVKGAVAGIIMPAHPTIGQHYRQEFFAGEAEDEAQVVNRGLDIRVPYGCFHNCIKTVEWTRLEPGIKEAKFYCPRVGFVKATDVQGPDTRLVLKHIVR
jgi:hypothetical protein